MQVQIRYFASVREALGIGAEHVDVPENVHTLGELRAWLRQRGASWEAALGDERALRMACDHVMSESGAVLEPGCEVAFFPPVTGG